MIPQCVQAILAEVQCEYVIVQKNDSVLNRSGKWSQKRYQKYQSIKLTIDQLRPTNWATKDKQLIQERLDCDKASDLSESGWIATDLTKERLTKHENKYEYW